MDGLVWDGRRMRPLRDPLVTGDAAEVRAELVEAASGVVPMLREMPSARTERGG
jgi:hypothetical protein